MKRLAQFVGALGSLLDLGATAMPRRAHRRRRQRSPAEQVRANWDAVSERLALDLAGEARIAERRSERKR